MGRRSRKRAGAESRAVDEPSEPVEPAAPVQAPQQRPQWQRRRARLDEAPQAPWHPFPLVELTILVGLILLGWGWFSDGDRQKVLLAGGLILIFLASFELTIREHFGGYRSHTALLALTSGFVAGAPVFLITEDRIATLAVALVAIAVAFVLLRTAFSRRSGGMSWRA